MKPSALAPIAMLAAASLAGCTCGRSSPSGGPAQPASSPATSTSSSALAASSAPRVESAPGAPAAAGETAASFSAPIAATTVSSGTVVAAALQAKEKKVVVSGIAPGGAVEWTSDAVRDVEWSPDVRLAAFPLGEGAAVVWSGPHGGGSGQSVALVGAKGSLQGAPFDIGTAMPCATTDALVWSERKGGKTSHAVRARSLAAAAPRELAAFESDGSVELACGDHIVYAVVEGDEDGRVVRLVDPAASGNDGGVSKKLSVLDPADDDEVDFEEYTVGDDLGLVRVGKSGSVHVRELASGKLGAWRRLGHDLGPDDDVAVVDGDATTTYLVYTSDESDSCGKGADEKTAKSVWLLRFDRKSGKVDDPVKLADPECGTEIGPFWMGRVAQGMVAGWGQGGGDSGAPLRGFVFHSLAPAADGSPVGRADRPADALADAGCHGDACIVVALAREAESDGMAPEPLKLLRYP
jgi:hypothetical protein